MGLGFRIYGSGFRVYAGVRGEVEALERDEVLCGARDAYVSARRAERVVAHAYARHSPAPRARDGGDAQSLLQRPVLPPTRRIAHGEGPSVCKLDVDGIGLVPDAGGEAEGEDEVAAVVR